MAFGQEKSSPCGRALPHGQQLCWGEPRGTGSGHAAVESNEHGGVAAPSITISPWPHAVCLVQTTGQKGWWDYHGRRDQHLPLLIKRSTSADGGKTREIAHSCPCVCTCLFLSMLWVLSRFTHLACTPRDVPALTNLPSGPAASLHNQQVLTPVKCVTSAHAVTISVGCWIPLTQSHHKKGAFLYETNECQKLWTIRN